MCGQQRWVSRFESAIARHPGLVLGVHWVMIAAYLGLIIIPVYLPAPPAASSPWNNFVAFSQFVIWSIWWPFVLLTMLGFGRIWCGLFCPEGALSGYASRLSSNRPVPGWMRLGWLPLAAFITITVLGQVFEVDEEPLPQLVILGGSTAAAIAIGLVYAKGRLAWCRYLCPVSLLFGVFSRLGAMHFKVDREKLAAAPARSSERGKKGPCPVLIHLPVMSTNRYCVMCFRCSGWRDAIHLSLRAPGEELIRIHSAEPLFWEVMFLFGGAIGLPLGVFYGEMLEWDGVRLVGLLLGCTAASVAVLSAITYGSVSWGRTPRSQRRVLKGFTCTGYLYAPISLFSLFLGLSKPTFSYFESIGLAPIITDAIRVALLVVGVVWSLVVASKILRLQPLRIRSVWASIAWHVVGLCLVLAAWIPIFIRHT